jgi:hypothetical protein
MTLKIQISIPRMTRLQQEREQSFSESSPDPEKVAVANRPAVGVIDRPQRAALRLILLNWYKPRR